MPTSESLSVIWLQIYAIIIPIDSPVTATLQGIDILIREFSLSYHRDLLIWFKDTDGSFINNSDEMFIPVLRCRLSLKLKKLTAAETTCVYHAAQCQRL